MIASNEAKINHMKDSDTAHKNTDSNHSEDHPPHMAQNGSQNHSQSEKPGEAGISEAEPSSEMQPSVKDLQKRIQDLEAQVKEKENKYLYLYAEFENFKRRSIRERSDLLKFGWESLACDLLQVVDNLERAIEHVPPQTDKNLVEGLKMVLHQLNGILQKQGVETIESLKKSFDPNLHEAVGAEKSDLPSGTIVKEHTRGYTLHGRLLRPARVLVSEGNSGDKSG